MTQEEVLLWLEREDRKRTAAVRQMLVDEGREDLALDLDRRLRDIALGLDAARNCWHSISPAQRRVLELMGVGRYLRRAGGSNTRYDAAGNPEAVANVCSIATARALCAHELVAPDGSVMDPEARFILTERGRFVLHHGRAHNAHPAVNG